MKEDFRLSLLPLIAATTWIMTATCGYPVEASDQQKEGTADSILPVYEDLSGDGLTDTLHAIWNGKRVVVIDENL
jgi:hypothetical protein